MKTIFFLVFAVTMLGCNKEDNAGKLNGKWRLINYNNITTGAIESEPSNINRSIIIEFSDNGSRGKMNGYTVTNSVGGEYELLMGNKMKTLSFGGTKLGEPDWGNKFWDGIYTASSYVRQSNKLHIYFNSDTEKMEFEKEQ